ncbi:hypothetical protein QZH41_006606 [Actinostola sp. cb2023]|nr:hypothetical protein QZH41_006606 [Actinostola sp. cb2023]
MRGVKEHYDCQIQDFTITDQYIEYNERQTKNRQGDEGCARKRARKYTNKIWRTDGGEQDPYRAFVEYVTHRPKSDDANVPDNFYLTPIDKTTSEVWYKKCPIGKNTLAKFMKTHRFYCRVNWLLKRLKKKSNRRDLHNKMKLYLIGGLLAVLVVSVLSMDATLENEIPALLEFTNDFSAENEIPALLNLVNEVSEEAKRGGGDVLHHLHCLELHKAGYCKYGLIRNKFCKKTCSCSDVLAQGCCKTLKNKNECASTWGMKYCHETCHKCFLCNIEPLGMQSKAIPDARITASSMWDGNHAPAQGRLNYKPPRGKAGSWSSRHNRVGQWIQVDLNRVTKVTGIATQGRTNANQWVTKYKLQYSSDGKTFNNYEGGKVFTANKDRNSVVKHNLYKPIIARYIRVLPQAWQGHMSLRMELYGCK